MPCTAKDISSGNGNRKNVKIIDFKTKSTTFWQKWRFWTWRLAAHGWTNGQIHMMKTLLHLSSNNCILTYALNKEFPSSKIESESNLNFRLFLLIGCMCRFERLWSPLGSNSPAITNISELVLSLCEGCISPVPRPTVCSVGMIWASRPCSVPCLAPQGKLNAGAVQCTTRKTGSKERQMLCGGVTNWV